MWRRIVELFLFACLGMSLAAQARQATITGTTYLRSSSVAYGAEDASAQTLPGVKLNLEGLFIDTSTSSGSFSLSRYSNSLNVPLNVTKPGYVELDTQHFKSSASTQTLNLGLYPETTVTPRPGFISGVFTMDVGGFLNDTYSRGLFELAYDRIRNTVGASLVANSDPVWVDAYDVATAKVTMNKTSDIPMMTREQYTRLVSAAHSRNMAFMMLLGVYPKGSLQLPWSVDTSNTAFWTAWFASYQAIVLEYVAIARDLNIEYVSLSMNSGFMTKLPVSYWSQLVTAIRAAGYKGKLVSQLMSNPDVSGGEWLVLNDSCCNGEPSQRLAKRLEFVQLFDYIVIDVYNLLFAKNTPKEVSRDQMKETFRWILDETSTYPVPTMIMLGTPSIHGGASTPDYVEPCIVCGSIAPDRQRDLMQQADAYQALFEVINGTPTGAGHVMGVLSWGYWFSDDYVTWQPTGGPALEMAYDKSANVRGKPAESVLRWWFDRLGGAVPATQYTIQSGWNLLGNTSTASLPVATAFGDASKVATVWRWVPVTAKWAFYDPSMSSQALSDYARDKGYEVLTSIGSGQGFWLNAKQRFVSQLAGSSALPLSTFQQGGTGTYQLSPGWNMIAVGDYVSPQNLSTTIGESAAGSVWAWDNALSNWYLYNLSLDRAGTLQGSNNSRNLLNFGPVTLRPSMGAWVYRQ